MDYELKLFQATLERLASGADVSSTVTLRSEICEALVRLGFRPNRSVILLLCSLRIRQPCPSHLEVARTLAAEGMLQRVRGVLLEEFLIDLLGFARVRSRLSRKFFTSYDLGSEMEERVWWAAERLERALQHKLLNVPAIDSIEQLVRAGAAARAFPPLPCKHFV